MAGNCLRTSALRHWGAYGVSQSLVVRIIEDHIKKCQRSPILSNVHVIDVPAVSPGGPAPLTLFACAIQVIFCIDQVE
jgi:hypothetical protein